MRQVALLVLEDGMVFPGYTFSHPALSLDELEQKLSMQNPRGMGELVFSTSMSGYVETITDPSYVGQLVCLTYPLIGNYGVDSRWSESVSGAPAIAGLVIHELYRGIVMPSRKTLAAWLSEHEIPGIEGVDTRLLTQHLRDSGAQNAALVAIEESDLQSIEKAKKLISHFPKMEGRNLMSEIGQTTWREYHPPGNEGYICTVMIYDCGVKQSIIGQLVRKQCRVLVPPHGVSAEEMLAKNPDMVLVSNGPGDPAVLTEQQRCIQGLVSHVPLCGICLGNQLLGIALGAQTYKMDFGHHGSNHPVQDLQTRKLYITSQNHGFALDEHSLPKGAEVWFRNVNDATVEGFMYPSELVYSVQFHPEAGPGPHDASWVFDYFIQRVLQHGAVGQGN